MTYMSVDSYEHFKDLIHPNIRHNIKHYRDGNMIMIPAYHGCHYANRNGTRKQIGYKRGEQCVLATINLIGKQMLKRNIKNVRSTSQDT